MKNVWMLFCAAAFVLSAQHAFAQAPKKPTPKADDIAQAKEDMVTLLDGRVLKGLVKRDDYASLAIELKGGKVETVEADDVGDVYYKDEPPSYKTAMDHYRKRAYSDARNAFQKALDEKKNTKTRDWIDQYVLYYIASCLKGEGKNSDAAAGFKKLRETAPDTRFAKAGFREEFDCRKKLGDVEGAKTLVTEIVASSKVDAALKMACRVSLAEFLFQQKKYDDARNEFSRLIGSGDIDIDAQATDGEIRCMAELKKSDEIERFCEARLTSPNSAIALIATAELSRIRFDKAGNNAAAVRKIFDLLLGAVVKYLPQKGSVLEAHHGKILYYLGRCYEKLAGFSQSNKDAAARYNAWAASTYRDLVRYHPTSPLSVDALSRAKELGKLAAEQKAAEKPAEPKPK